jgi:hypothetical protein
VLNQHPDCLVEAVAICCEDVRSSISNLMRLAAGSNILLYLSIQFILPMPALATSAITCHCFRDRSYDPAQPSMGDPYFLATTQNSFFAIVFPLCQDSCRFPSEFLC